ncbi:MAG: helicase [Firmicutes bacterium]|nr:helicase [Bacillota bacterium]
MAMLNLTTEKIAGGCQRRAVFLTGVEYYRSGLVEDVAVEDVRGVFCGYIRGTWRYRITAQLTPQGDVVNATCQCSAFARYFGYCEHIVALLLTVRDKFPDWDPSRARAEQVADNMFGLLSDTGETLVAGEQLNLEAIIKYDANYYGTRYSLGFRVGLDRLYVVKDVGELVQAMDSEQPLYFGKEFTFDPRHHCFDSEDEELLRLFAAILDTNMLAREQGARVGGRKDVLFAPSMLPRVMDLLRDKLFTLVLNGRSYREVALRDEDLPLNVAVGAQGEELGITVDVLDWVVPLDRRGKFWFFKGTVFRISGEQHAVLPALYYGLKQSQAGRIIIPSGHRSRFASELLPLLQKSAAVKVDKELESVFYRAPLAAKMFLDLWEQGLAARLEYTYGDYSFNPLGGEPEMPAGQIMVRDRQTEHRLMEFLERAQFTVLGQELHLEGDEAMFEFLVEIVPELQKICAVYYSDRLAAKRLLVTPRMRGRMELNNENNLLEFDFDIEGIERSELSSVLRALREKRRYHRLRDGSFIDFAGEELTEMAQLISDLELSDADLTQDVLKLPRYRALAFDTWFRDGKFQSVQRGRELRNFLQTIREAGEAEFPVPETLTATLRDYQVTGYHWLRTLSACNLGGILADEMGLGKTVQMIALLAAEREVNADPALVVAPTSLVYNWQAELANFAPGLKVQLIVGSKEERKRQVASLAGVDVAITSYALLRRDRDLYRDCTFSHCILDEAQYIKNPGSLTARAARDLRGRRYFALTGTPIENSLSELWSVFEFLMPGFFGSYKNFIAKYAKGVANGDELQSQRLAARVAPFVLRRLKKDVLPELPAKTEQRMLSELTREQKKIYLAWLDKIRGEAAVALAEDGFDKSRVKILAGLMRLRQICCHPGLFLEGYTGGSGKLEQLQEVTADSLAAGHRLLIFSQFTSMLKLIRTALSGDGRTIYYLDGATPAAERLAMASSFNNGDGDVFLVSLKAGGTGLNLTGADMVIHYDLWWNPAVEDQASDRAHRIGQERAVQVLKFIAMGTIDEKIYALQQQKKELFDRVIKPGEQLLSTLTEEQIREILGLS